MFENYNNLKSARFFPSDANTPRYVPVIILILRIPRVRMRLRVQSMRAHAHTLRTIADSLTRITVNARILTLRVARYSNWTSRICIAA